MARKPLLPQYQGEPCSIGPQVINQRPEFVAAIGRCAALWGFVEHNLGLLLGVLLRASDEPTIAVFTTLRRFSNQWAAIDAAASKTLTADNLRVLRAASAAVIQPAGKARADLVHGQWGIMSNRADLALWVEATHHSPWNTMAVNLPPGQAPDFETLKKSLFVYSLPDMDEVYSQILAAWEIVFDTLCAIKNPTLMCKCGVVGAQLFDHLAQRPEIRAVLDRQDRQKETA
jgi:hypothetical protein